MPEEAENGEATSPTPRSGGNGLIRLVLKKSEVPLFAAYGALTVFVTWPAVTLSPRVHAMAGDPTWAIYKFWWFRYSFLNHLPVTRVPLVAIPWGFEMSYGFALDPLTEMLWRGLSIVTNEAVTYNAWLMIAFFLNAVAMYYLVRYLTGSRGAAFFSGLAFAFCPYLLRQGDTQIGLVAVMLLPVFVLLLVRAWHLKTLPSYALCGTSFIVLTFLSYQNAVLAGFFAVPFIAVMLISGKPWSRVGKGSVDWKQFLKAASVAVTVLIVLGALFLVFGSSYRAGLKVENKSDWEMKSGQVFPTTASSARPLDYLLPYAGNWGGALGRLLGDRLEFAHRGSVSGASVVFLGFVPLALAAYGAFARLRKRRPGKTDSGEEGIARGNGEEGGPGDHLSRRIVWAILASGAVAFVLSMPPRISVAGHLVRTPSYVLSFIVPNFRAYSRLGLVVMFCVALLAGYGVSGLIGRYRLRGRRSGLLVAVLCLVVLLEFVVVPPFNTIDTAAATDYTVWLRDRPADTTVAIYPLARNQTMNDCEYMLQLRMHHRRLVNGAGKFLDEAERYRQSMLNLWHPATPGLLAGLGTDYVVVYPKAYERHDAVNYFFSLDVDTSKVPDGLELVARLPDSEVFKVTAAPAEFVPLFSGRPQPYVDSSGNTWHGGLEEVEVEITSSLDMPQTCDIVFPASGARVGRRYIVRLNGRTVTEVDLETRPVTVELQGVTLAPGKNTLVVEPTDPPQGPVDWALVGDIMVKKR